MGKLVVARHVFDVVIADHIHRNLGNDYEFFLQAKDTLEIRKLPQVGGELETIYVDFGGDLSTSREFSQTFSVPRKQIVLARDWRQLEGRRVRLKPVNQDYPWSLLNWNHSIHEKARDAVNYHEAYYGSAE